MVKGVNPKAIDKEFIGQNYSQFKESLGKALVEYLAPYRERYLQLLKDKTVVQKALQDGTTAAQKEAQKTMLTVKKALLMDYPNIF